MPIQIFSFQYILQTPLSHKPPSGHEAFPQLQTPETQVSPVAFPMLQGFASNRLLTLKTGSINIGKRGNIIFYRGYSIHNNNVVTNI
jgi:hypothetical protein